MSTDTPPTAADEHLDEEATSAALDGESTAAERAHLDGCATCRAAVERLRAVSGAVAAPMVVDDDVREAAIAAALGASDASDPSSRQAQRGPGSPVSSIAAPRTGGRRGGDLAPWLGAAAVLLLLVLAVPLLRGSGGGDESTSAATDAATGAAAESQTSEDGAAALAAAPPVDVGDLGSLDAGADLRPVVAAALGSVEADAASGSAGSDAADGEEASEEAEAGGGAVADSPTAPAPAPAPAAGSAGGVPAAPGAPAPNDGSTERTGASCEGAVRAALPEAGALLLVGTATVEGAPALVYGFAAPTERPTVLVALVRGDGCELITFQSYARG